MEILMLMKRFRNLFFGVFLGMALSGCVKEHRGLCPCRLLLDFSSLDTSVVSLARINIVGPDGYVFDDFVGVESFAEEALVLVPKGDCWLNVYCGEQGMAVPERGLQIPYGDECPPVYMQSAYLDTDCELVSRQVLVRKNYCRLSVFVADVEHFPFSLAVKGMVAGYGADGTPADGDFFHKVETVSDEGWTISVPRQTDDSMLLEVSDGTDVLKTFALGKYICASGYDWNAADLSDITVGIDYTRTKLTVSVRGWDEVYEFDVVI